MRFNLIKIFISICVFILIANTISAFSDEPSLPPIPLGYSSESMLLAHYMLGFLKAIDPDNVPTPDDVVEVKNIEYGKVGDRALQLDLYLPKELSGPIPGMIFIHGGAWKSGEREVMKYYSVRFARRGYAAATISYRLIKEAIFPAAVQDAKCAVRWMRANAAKYNIDPNRIGVSGNSAGGHLSLMIGYSSDVPELEGEGGHEGVSSRVQALADFYGPVDFTTDFAIRQKDLINFLGATYKENPELYEYASPITHLTSDDPPTLIFHGTLDRIVPIPQADMLAKKLDDLGVDCVYDRFNGYPHTMDAIENVNKRCLARMFSFFDKYLKPNRNGN